MRRLIVCLIIEILLFCAVSYFFARWNQPISNGRIDATHGTIGIILLIFPLINLLIAYVSFSKHTNKYPKNNLSEYLFDPKTSQLGYQGNGNYIIEK